MADLVPEIFSNPAVNAITVTLLPAALYTAAAYGHLLTNSSLAVSIVISILFACLEYTVRVPIIKYSHEKANMSNTSMQIVWVILTLLLAFLLDLIIETK